MVIHHNRFNATTYHVYVSSAARDYTFFVEAEDAAGRPVAPYRKVRTIKWVTTRKNPHLMEAGRKYQHMARMKGKAVPGKRVSYALAMLLATARGAIAYAQTEYAQETEFCICSTKKDGVFEATLYLGHGKTISVKRATGNNHLEAVQAIMQRYVHEKLGIWRG
ncbi:hypothetical protein P280DRAFT_484799 [Massarina eburnea CBS 473.64]|uniref:Uncharacterized protein n=1 Tax=Massarina eburnea CBS 473.64 TaxID=1395130 RepID=A0A6A6RI80_9PLEO|nr:hypothetical protein P280DRAFT_484799 [Massarina eburnea CBS 473.64]